MAKFSRKFLAAPPTSVAIERLFSQSGLLFTKKRNRLQGAKAEKLLFLKSNLPKCNYDYDY
ncbi:MAG: hAT transposon family protein [Gammaproteobacteria bacterium]|nr:hAT transposon family protein [Gammaproteobacteria bacterium]